MEPLLSHYGKVVTLNKVNVDTDQMVPKQFLKRIQRTGFGDVLFYDWRYLSDGTSNPEFEMNHPRFQGASILLTQDNFGCGSSREHAVWAVRDYGIRVLLAPSFADIFYGNCINNGILPITLPNDKIEELFRLASVQEHMYLKVDITKCEIMSASGWSVAKFNLEDHYRNRLMLGLDNVGLTLTKEYLISEYENRIPPYSVPKIDLPSLARK